MKANRSFLKSILIIFCVSIFMFSCTPPPPPTPIDWGNGAESTSSFDDFENQDTANKEKEEKQTFCATGSEWCVGNTIYPVPPMRCSTRYSNSHQALDVASNSSARKTLGESIMASWRGTVEKSFIDPVTEGNATQGLGNLMVVEYKYEDIPADQRPGWLGAGESIYVRYNHLNGRKFSEGQSVNPGDVIGTVGQTGLATGPHIHMEVKSDKSESYSSYSRLKSIHNPIDIFPSICTN
jgi:hypothetical protein